MRLLIAVLLVGLISGCASPKVVYNTLNAGEKDLNGKIKFQLTDSIIKFDYPKDSKGDVIKTQLSVTSTGLTDTKVTYSLEGAPWYKNWFNSTDLTATHADGNPLLLTQVGTSMTDQAIPVLKALGTIGASVAPLVLMEKKVGAPAAAPPPPTPPTIPLPVGIKISKFLTDISGTLKENCNYTDVEGTLLSAVDRDSKIICKNLSLVLPKYDSQGNLNDNMKDTMKADIIMDAVPSGALLINEHPNKKTDITFPFESKTMIYSACRPMHITLKFTDKRDISNPVESTILDTTLVVADSDWVQTIALPSKGSVKFSSSCGADSIPSDFTRTTILDDFSQAAQSAQSVSDAISKASTSGVTK